MIRTKAIGKCLGIQTSQNGQYTNRKMAVSNSYEDRWGQAQTDVVEIDISGNSEEIEQLCNKADSLKGKFVEVDIICDALMTKRQTAWLRIRIDSNGSIVERKQTVARAA